jgi:hypothetical protein
MLWGCSGLCGGCDFKVFKVNHVKQGAGIDYRSGAQKRSLPTGAIRSVIGKDKRNLGEMWK